MASLAKAKLIADKDGGLWHRYSRSKLHFCFSFGIIASTEGSFPSMILLDSAIVAKECWQHDILCNSLDVRPRRTTQAAGRQPKIQGKRSWLLRRSMVPGFKMTTTGVCHDLSSESVKNHMTYDSHDQYDICTLYDTVWHLIWTYAIFCLIHDMNPYFNSCDLCHLAQEHVNHLWYLSRANFNRNP